MDAVLTTHFIFKKRVPDSMMNIFATFFISENEHMNFHFFPGLFPTLSDDNGRGNELKQHIK